MIQNKTSNKVESLDYAPDMEYYLVMQHSLKYTANRIKSDEFFIVEKDRTQINNPTTAVMPVTDEEAYFKMYQFFGRLMIMMKAFECKDALNARVYRYTNPFLDDYMYAIKLTDDEITGLIENGIWKTTKN